MSRMDKRFWDAIADNFDSEIFDTLANDRNNLILKHINRFSSRKAIACDFGCGIGKYVPILGKRFKSVYAIDISNKCLKLAQESHRYINNVVYLKGDLSKSYLHIEAVNFAISINMLIMPSVERRLRILTNIFRYISKGGKVLFVLPSLESTLYSHFRLVEWNLKLGIKPSNPVSQRLINTNSRKFSIRTGVLNIEGVPTKHYLKEELIIILTKVGFKISSITKVEYSWTTEFEHPPRWMKDPYPWDWLVICQKD